MRPFRRLLAALALSLPAVLPAQSTTPVVSTALPAQSLSSGANATVDLRNHFNLPGVTGTVVQLNTVLGRFNFELFDDTPITKANFLSYTNAGTYNNTIIHRSVAGFVIQGGGYTYSVTSTHIPTGATIRNEFRRSNVRGTVAMAKVGGNPDSATSEWFVNLGDNSANLDNQNGGFTVFARVLGNGMSVVDSIAALQVASINFGAVSLENVPVRNITAGQTQLQLQNLIAVTSISVVPIYPAADASASVLSFSASSANPAVVTAAVSGSTLTLTPVATGTTTVNVTATDTNGSSVSQTVTVSVGGTGGGSNAPGITIEPQSQIRLASGAPQTVVFSLSATGSAPLTYQWRRGGVALPNQTNATLILGNATEAAAGTYSCVVGNSAGSVESRAATLAFVSAAPAELGRLSNLSIRTNAGTGAQTLIVGFSLGGTGTAGTAPLLVRAVGPSLGQFGLTGTLTDPVATLFQGSATVATNDNWGGTTLLADRASQVGAFALVPSGLDAALAPSPAVGSYTVQVSEKSGRTGIALAEIYDATPAAAFTATTPRLVNVSARTEVGAGNDILIAGFYIGGTTARTVLIRAIGPTLAVFGVTDTLSDPRLRLFSGSTLVAENDNWGGQAGLTAAAAAVGAFALSNPASSDAVLLLTLPPGGYTAQVSGANNGTGVALVEVYELP
ncbi:MAG: peptidylprolyl isomerase [Verrucomicrobia bacterium]|nr:peptidylprolyl isomerase [Verrucomicrobiota bacterium]